VKLHIYSKGVFIAFAGLFLLGTVFAVNFSHVIGIDSEYDIKRFLVVGFVWLFSLGLCFVKDIEFIRLSTATKIFITIFFTLAISSAWLSKHPFWAMVEIANIGLLIIAFLLFSVSIRAIEKDRFIFGVYVCFLLFSVFTLVKYLLFLAFSYVDTQSFDIHGLITGYVNVRFFNQLQVMVIPVLFLPFFNQNLTKFRNVSLVVISLHWMVLLQTEARGGMLSLILASSFVSYFLSKDNRKRFIFSLLQTIFAGFCLWLVFIIIIPSWLMDSANFQIRTSSSGRLDLWLYSLTSIQERIFIGFGPMSFTWAEGKPLPVAHPHNAVMQLLYEYGVISCIACVIWVTSRVYNKLQALTQVENVSLCPIIYAVLSALIYSLFSGVVVMPFAQITLVFLVAALVQYGAPTFYKAGRFARALMFLAVSIASYAVLMTYKHEELLPALFPRIWVNGLISY
jgi:O-antigen ligase